jgi:hypothetical protein
VPEGVIPTYSLKRPEVADVLAGSETCQQTTAVVGDARFPRGVAASRRAGSSCCVLMKLCGSAASERLETAAAPRYRDEAGLRPETTQTEAGPRTEPSSVTNWDSASRMSAAIVGRISSIRSPH